MDGATGANNPVYEVWNEAQYLWPSHSSGSLEDQIHCLVSIGTGVPSLKPFGKNLLDIAQTLRDIATGSEDKAEDFCQDKPRLDGEGRYYRFSVLHGLEDIGLEDSSQKNKIVAATSRYLESRAVFKQMRAWSSIVVARPDPVEGQQSPETNTVQSAIRPERASSNHGHDSSWATVVNLVSSRTARGDGRIYMRPEVHSHLSGNFAFHLPDFVGTFYHYDYTEEFQRINQQRYPTTCEWVIRSDDILWWCQSKKTALLWISGAPGVGKSTLLTHLVNVLRSQPEPLGTKESSTVIYSFCNEQRNDTASTVISVAIHQILSQCHHLRDFAFNHDRSHFDGTGRWSLKKAKDRPAPILWNLFCKIVQESRVGKVFLVVDALDECDPQSQNDLLRLFYGAVPGPLCLKILFSSRLNTSLSKTFSFWSVRAPGNFRQRKLEDLEDYINQDIDCYIRGEAARIGHLKALSSQEMTLIIKK